MTEQQLLEVVVKLYTQTLWRIGAPSTLAWRRPHPIAPHRCITFFSDYASHIFILSSDWLVVGQWMEQDQVSVAALWLVPMVCTSLTTEAYGTVRYVWLPSIHPDLALIFCGWPWPLWFLTAHAVWIPRLCWLFLSLVGAFISGRRSWLALASALASETYSLESIWSSRLCCTLSLKLFLRLPTCVWSHMSTLTLLKRSEKCRLTSRQGALDLRTCWCQLGDYC